MNKNILGHLSNYNLPPIGEEHPYTETDGLVFAIFSFAPAGPDVRRFKGAFSIEPVGKTMGEVAGLLVDTDNNELMSSRFKSGALGDYKKHSSFFNYILKNRRYKDIKITGFTYNNDGFSQFAAFTFELCQGEYVVGYRGTDDSLEGWYESVKLSLNDIPSRQLAFKYLQSEMDKNEGIFRIVGHSKGGHLALCAAILIDVEYKTKIRSIINFDGPGFTMEFIAAHKESILLLQHKVFCFSPAAAIVSSMLFGQDILYYEKNMRYIKPYRLKMPPNQHNYFNWAITPDGKFKLAPRSALSISFQNVYEKLYNMYDPKELDQIFDGLYEQASTIHKDSDNVVSRFDIWTFVLGAAIKLLAVPKGHRGRD